MDGRWERQNEKKNDCRETRRGLHGGSPNPRLGGPGVLLGGFVVDYALELIGKEVEADAIVETRYCLPDAVQLLTPCTCGNGWMKVLDWDKFALSLYDKKTREGFRVRLDVDKTAAFPNLYNWFMKLVEKKNLPLEVLNQTILEAGREALSATPVTITNSMPK